MPPQTDPTAGIPGTTGQAGTDPIQGILDPLTGVDKTVKALAWDAYYQSPDQQTFKTKLDALNLPQAAKASLWDAKFGQAGGPPRVKTPSPAAGPQKPQAVRAEQLLGEDHPVASAGLDVLTGVGRGAMGTVQTLASPIRKALGMAPAAPVPGESTLAGSIGKGTEQVGEFLIPEAVAGKYARLYNAASKLKAAGYGAQAARLIGAIPEAVMQAIGAYTTAKIQGDEAPGVAAGVSAALPMIGAGAAAVAPKIMRSALGQVSADVLKRYKTTTQEIANTLMENGANVTKRGLDKLQVALDISDDQLDKIIKGLKGTIDPKKVAARTTETAKKFGEQVNPKEDLDLIEQKTKEFMAHPVHGQQVITGVTQQSTGIVDPRTGTPIMKSVPVYAQQTGPLSAAEAQSMKRGTYQQLKGKYTKLGSAGVETEKALARGLREEIETLAHSQGIHDVEAINKNEAKLMAALEATGERLAKMEKPLDAGSIQYAVRWAARHPLSALAAVAKLEGAPIRSIVARTLSSEAPSVQAGSLMIRAAVTALASGGKPEEGETADVSSATRPRASRDTSGRPPIRVIGGGPGAPGSTGPTP